MGRLILGFLFVVALGTLGGVAAYQIVDLFAGNVAATVCDVVVAFSIGFFGMRMWLELTEGAGL